MVHGDFVDHLHGSWVLCGTWFIGTPDHIHGSGDFIDHIQDSWGFSPAILLFELALEGKCPCFANAILLCGNLSIEHNFFIQHVLIMVPLPHLLPDHPTSSLI